jgi:hypothetical protein
VERVPDVDDFIKQNVLNNVTINDKLMTILA